MCVVVVVVGGGRGGGKVGVIRCVFGCVGVGVGVFGDIYDLHVYAYMGTHGNSERVKGGEGGGRWGGGGRGRRG